MTTLTADPPTARRARHIAAVAQTILTAKMRDKYPAIQVDVLLEDLPLLDHVAYLTVAERLFDEATFHILAQPLTVTRIEGKPK